MSHRIFTGPFAALETRLIQEIALIQKDDPLAPVAILVGSNILASCMMYRRVEHGFAAFSIVNH